MICVTGAGGTVGSEVIKQLEASKTPFRAAFFSENKASAARSRGIDAVTIDYNKPETLEAAFQGCDKLFLLGPNVENQTQLELNAVEAARIAGVRHIVKLSALGADHEDFLLAKIHRPVEKAIQSSGIGWTILRPNGYMQNVVTYLGDTIRSEGAFFTASADAKISHVDVRDLAAVAVKALKDPGHEGKVYSLSGPEALTYDDIATELTKVLGRTISHINLSPSDLKNGMIAAGTPEWFTDMLLDLERYYREQRASIITGDIKKVTGRDPIKFEQYARDYATSLTPLESDAKVMERGN
ncbi:MAG TPA: SDR family oxidoreductase [Blastocatellia bacterium]|nr:SDR family oxidoreductase [Blastocatellia bacterium]